MQAKQPASEQPADHRRNQKEIKICMEKKENKNLKPLESSKSSSKREVHSKSSIPQDRIQTSNKQHDFAPGTTRKKK